MWVLGDDGLAINLDRYDRLDTIKADDKVNVLAVKDDRHLVDDAIHYYRLRTFDTEVEALDYIKRLVSRSQIKGV